MDSHYEDKDIDLKLVGEWVEQYFTQKGFNSIKKVTEETIEIISKPKPIHEMIGLINVHISGTSNDFTIKFFSGSRSDAYVKYGRLTSLFGGGILFLRGIKSQENERKFEESFWVYIEEQMNSFLKHRDGYKL
jgi:hypothetical protein